MKIRCLNWLSLLPSIVVLFCFEASAAPNSGVCAISDAELQSRFIAAAGTAEPPDRVVLPPLARFNKRNAGIRIFTERTSRPAPDMLARNLAVFEGIGLLYLGREAFGFGIAFSKPPPERQRFVPDDPSDDIKLIFIDKPTKQKVFANQPRTVLSSHEGDRCRVYLDLGTLHDGIATISRSHILVDDDVPLKDLPPCIADALARSSGLLRWRQTGSDEIDRFTEAKIFMTALYAIH